MKAVELGSNLFQKRALNALSVKLFSFAIDNDKPSVALVHKGILKYTEGAFKEVGL